MTIEFIHSFIHLNTVNLTQSFIHELMTKSKTVLKRTMRLLTIYSFYLSFPFNNYKFICFLIYTLIKTSLSFE